MPTRVATQHVTAKCEVRRVVRGGEGHGVGERGGEGRLSFNFSSSVFDGRRRYDLEDFLTMFGRCVRDFWDTFGRILYSIRWG